MAKISEFDTNSIYKKNDYCSYNGYLCICIKETTGPGAFQSADWMSLGYILKDKGYVVANEEDLSYKDEEYLNIKGGVLSGNLKFNIPNETIGERQPFSFIATDSTSDAFVLRGGNDSVVITSSNIVNDKNKLASFDILPLNSEVDIISKNTFKVFTGAETIEQAQQALKIDKSGEIHIKNKSLTVLGDNSDLIATEAQVYQLGEERLAIRKETRDTTTYSKIEVPTEYTLLVDENSSNNMITNKKYVDSCIESASTSVTSATDNKLKSYLKLAGGNITGTLQVSGSLIVPSKSTEPTNNATAPATEAQLYNTKTALSSSISTLDTTVVHKNNPNNTKETITGAKIFTATNLIKANTPALEYQSNVMDITNDNFAAGRNTIAWCKDKNGYESGGVYNFSEYNATSGTKNVKTSMYAYNRTTGTATMGWIQIEVDKDGNKLGYAPTPGANNTSTITKNSQSWIATVGWVNNPDLATNVVHRGGTEPISGDKTFNGTNTFNNKIIRKSSFGAGGSEVFTLQDNNNKGEIKLIGYYTGNQVYNRLWTQSKTSGKDIYLDIIARDTGSSIASLNGSSTIENTTAAESSTSSNVLATKGWVNNWEKSTKIVHRDGTETISGLKTFNETITHSSSGQWIESFKITNTNVANNYANPSISSDRYVGANATDGTFYSWITFSRTNDGKSKTCINARRRDSSSSTTNNDASIGVQIDANNNKYAWAPTPAVGAGGETIATCGYINNKFQLVNSLPSVPDANTWYAIPE